MPVAFGAANDFATGINLFSAAAGAHTLVLTAADAAGNVSTDTLHVIMAAPAPFTVASLTPAADTLAVGVTYRPIVTFSRAVDPATLTARSFYATDPSGAVVPAAIAPLQNGTGAWLLFSAGMPGSSTITLHLDGAVIRAADGTLLQTAGFAATGTQLLQSFQTASTSIVPGTSITGIVVDPGADNTPLTPDDVSSTTGSSADFAHDTWKLPLAGVTLYVLGHPELTATTDAAGRFTLSDVPAGDVKLVVNGRTAANAPSGFFFPEMTLDLQVRAGVANTVGSSLGAQDVKAAEQGNPSVYLPRVSTGIFQPLSATAPTVITANPDTAGASGLNLTAQQIGALSLTVQPGSLLDASGNPVANPVIGISPVPAALVKDMLPAGLEQHTFDITIQAPAGTVFTAPATLTMPNVFGLLAGQKTYMLSFNHTTGKLEIDGTGTVSADGQTVTSDPGSGVIQPGWHGYTDPRTKTKTKVIVKNPATGIKEVVFLNAQNAQEDAFNLDKAITHDSGVAANNINSADFAVRQFDRKFLTKIGKVTGRFTPLGFGLDAVVLRGDKDQALADLETANRTGSLSDGAAFAEDGLKVVLDTSITVLDGATLLGLGASETGIGVIEAAAAQGLKDVINGLSLTITVADAAYDYAGQWAADRDNAGNSKANIIGPKLDPTLVLHVSGDAWQGAPAITVSIDGVQVLGPTAITASHAAGKMQDIAISGILGQDIHTVQVSLVNPASGPTVDTQRNAYISGATFDGRDVAFSTPIYGIAGAKAAATFQVGTLVTAEATKAETAFNTLRNEVAFQSALAVRERADLLAAQPILAKVNTKLPNNGLTQEDLKTLLSAFGAYLNDTTLLGGHTTTASLPHAATTASSIAVPQLYADAFQPYNPPPTHVPPLTAQQAADRDAAFALGKPYTQTWLDLGVTSGGSGAVIVQNAGPPATSYTYYPPGKGQPQLAAQVFGALTATDGTVQRFSFNPAAGMDQLLAPDTFYKLDAFDPNTGDTGMVTFLSSGTGTTTTTPDLALVNVGEPTLADGLTAKQAFIIGVDPSIASNLAPGLTDLAALQQGLFTDAGLPTSTGIQASVALKGEACAIALAGTRSGAGGGTRLLALVATGSYGLAIVDVSDAKQPVVLSQLQLAGGAATGIAVDPQAQVAAVADGPGGLQLISYADLANPAVIATAPGNFTRVALLGSVAYASTGGTVQALDAQTGELLGTLGGAQGAITGLALDGATLYAMDAGRVLQAVALVGSAMTVLSSVRLPGGGNGLVVGNGVATVPAGDAGGNGGYLTVDVSDPAHPKLIAGVANAGLAGSAAALNGSGLGLFAGQIQVRAQALQNDLDLVNTSDPTSTGALVTRFSLPAAPGDVAISGGLGFVADGAGGLQVVRYAAYTPNTVAPTLTVTQGPADIDPATPGTQVLEGASVPLGIQVSSPGQVRSVEVLLNGQSVLTSLSYPFNLSVALPTIAANGGSAAGLQVRATDTNGNVTTTASIALQLVPDVSPPRLVSATIAENSVISTSTKTLLFTFSKALQPGAAAAGVFTLRDAGGAAIQPTAVALVGGGRTVQATYGALPVGTYAYTVQASQVLSAAWVPLGAGVVTTDFTVQAFSTEWAPRTGGLWQTPANWTTGAAPTAADSAFIGVRLPVVFGGGTWAAAVLVDSNGELDVTGGTLTVGQRADLPAGTLSIGGGAFAPNGTATVGQLVLSGGALGGTGTLTATAGLQWTGGAMLAGGLTVTGPAAAYAILGGVALARELDLGGAGVVSGTLTLGSGGAAGVLAVAAGGTLSLAGTLTADGTVGDLVRNAGTVSASGTGTLAGVTVAGGGKLLAAGANTLNLQSATVRTCHKATALFSGSCGLMV